MKTTFIKLFSLLILLSTLTTTVSAQSDKTTRWLVTTHEVMPSKKAEYENAVKNFNASIKGVKPKDMEWYTLKTSTYDYYYVEPFDSLAQLDNSPWDVLRENMGEENFKKGINAIDACTTNRYDALYRRPAEFDYIHSSLKDATLNYRVWQIYKMKPGTYKETKEVAKAWNDLYKKYDVVDAFALYFGDIGAEFGTLIAVHFAEDAAGFAGQQQDLFTKTGEEGQKLWERTEALMMSYEIKEGYYRPDLSVINADK